MCTPSSLHIRWNAHINVDVLLPYPPSPSGLLHIVTRERVRLLLQHHRLVAREACYRCIVTLAPAQAVAAAPTQCLLSMTALHSSEKRHRRLHHRMLTMSGVGLGGNENRTCVRWSATCVSRANALTLSIVTPLLFQ